VCLLSYFDQQTLPDGSKLPLPPALLGVLGNDTKKKTILIYGHLDVQPAKKEDGLENRYNKGYTNAAAVS
jgi:acetylornithine deacetylase/succinyl-diaminopimelate desuccinylase-like protein